ncbi:DNA circularization protein [Komagataeibacter diospyri]|uniref:Bacteriophage protein n=1 Tax=Komagataeibacter diospyri TaxID=1932662 RepID=A0A4P5NN50_9PROT|nr:DNA circularization N-terminal domain-containing protein [Komagataeibacter diospyri]GCE83070.1 bacteriophage protein [Komagataeibacter diospyri]
MSGTLTRLAEEYLQCSFRGVPFVVVGSGGQNGRNTSLHRYPYLPTPWVEDLGRAPRPYRFRGFLCGAECFAQRQLLSMAAETAGTGLLIHPTIGAIQASLLRFDWYERDGVMGVIDVELEFIESSSYLSTTIMLALDAAIGIAATAFSSAASSDYTSGTTASYDYGTSVVHAGRTVASSWATGARTAIRSPSTFSAAIATLPGNNGRYASGNATQVNEDATVSSVLSDLTAGGQTIEAGIAAVSASTDGPTLAAAILALTELLRSAITDPGTQIAQLAALAVYEIDTLTSAAPIGGAISTVQTATAMLCRQAALISIAQACADWQPTSSAEAVTLREQVGLLLDDEAIACADAGNDVSYQAIRALRAQVLQDLSTRAAQLPDVMTVTRNAPLPALVLAQQIYRNASRAPDLIRRADPIHPAFMPTSFEALTS